MNKKTYRGPYSQRRYSNATLLSAVREWCSLTLSVNDPAMGGIRYEIVSTPVNPYDNPVSKEETNKETHHTQKPNEYAMFSTTTTARIRKGSVVRVIATPSSGYTLDRFTGSGSIVSTQTSMMEFTINEDTEVRANFREWRDQTEVKLTFAYDASKGKIQVNGHDLTKSGTYTGYYGSTARIEAIPNEGYKFDHWTNIHVGAQHDTPQIIGNNPHNEQLVWGDQTIRATFKPVEPGQPEYPADPFPETPGGDDDPLEPNNGGESPNTGGNGGETPNPGGSENPGSGSNGNENPTIGKAKAFLKQWWWAVAIAAWVAYKEWKGGRK